MHRLLDLAALTATAAIFSLTAEFSTAQDVLPWRLAEYPAGGPAFATIVAEPLIGKPDLLLPTCRALAPGNARQAASGFAGIGIAVATAQTDMSDDIVRRLPDCCPFLVSENEDANVRFGAALALATREISEGDIHSAREVDQLAGICGNETLLRSYEIALGNDRLSRDIAQDGPFGPDVTGSIDPPPTGGGGLPSAN